jgi:hypothetical protein
MALGVDLVNGLYLVDEDHFTSKKPHGTVQDEARHQEENQDKIYSR